MKLSTTLCLRACLGVILSLIVLPLAAQPRAWLDRDRISANETVTLNIQAEGMARPDYAPLQRDFSINGRSSRTGMDGAGVRTLYAVALQPRRSGRIVIPPLRIGNAQTAPLVLQVDAVRAPLPTGAGDDVFIESEPDDASPYVQQTVGWTVRLYSAAPLVSGQLDQPAPEGASLQQVGEDARYSREVAGRRYEVIERRYQLIPERSGALPVPGARFEGRGTGGFFDELFGERGASLSAQAPVRVLQVQPAPASALQPWLPLHNLQLRYATTPRDLRTGEAGSLVIEAVADGATAAQMPELQLPPIEGVQVFADPVQADETFRAGRPRVKLTRRYSLVPSRAGAARLAGMRIDWWDVDAGAVRTATLPPLSWTVTAGNGGATPVPAVAGRAEKPTPPATAVTQEGGGANRGWALATLLFAALWLFTLVWGLHRRAHAAPAQRVRDSALANRHDRVRTGTTSVHSEALLKRALGTGDLGDVADVLCALAGARDMDEVRSRLDDMAQREAVNALERARWGGGDGALARRQLRDAFAQGPRWRVAPTQRSAPLPPLYPS